MSKENLNSSVPFKERQAGNRGSDRGEPAKVCRPSCEECRGHGDAL